MKLEFCQILKNTQISNFMKICPVGFKLFVLMDRQTERHDEAIVAFHNFVNVPENLILIFLRE